MFNHVINCRVDCFTFWYAISRCIVSFYIQNILDMFIIYMFCTVKHVVHYIQPSAHCINYWLALSFKLCSKCDALRLDHTSHCSTN